jgi:Reverse transcriptase (RNA-dependent DNA polymerase)
LSFGAETVVSVQSDARGVFFLLPKRDIRSAPRTSMSNGIQDICPRVPFLVKVANFGGDEIFLPKNALIGYVFPHPTCIISLVGEEDTDVPDLPDLVEEEKHPLEENDASEETKVQDEAPKSWRDEVDLPTLQGEWKGKVMTLLERYSHMWDGSLGEIKATKHRIQLIPGSKPVHSHPYRAGPKAREMERQEVERMLKADVIEPACSEWASPVVLVPKPDGSLRFCVDYRKLNSITVKDTYPLPRMDESIDSLGDAAIFSTLDCNSGYWQIPINEEDRDKTTFTSHVGAYRFIRMPFGLCNAPATFQRSLDIILSRVKCKSCLVYLDDVIVFSRTIEEHFGHLQEVLSLLERAGITLKLSKCHFFKDTVDYLGHVIVPGRLAIATKNTDALKQAKHPTTQTELPSFLGLCNVYRRFVPNFSRIARPLNDLLKKG